MELLCFKPKIWRLFPKKCVNLGQSFSDKIRYAYRLLGGYRIYTLNSDGKSLGYAVMQRGKVSRYPFVGKRDWLLGPYLIDRQHRGHGYAKEMLELVKQDMKSVDGRIYACILLDNPASIKTVEKIGYRQVGYLDARSAYKKKLVEQSTPCGVWCLDMGE